MCMYAEAAGGIHIPKAPKCSNDSLKQKSSSIEMKPKSYAQKKQEEKVRAKLKAATPPAAPASAKQNVVPGSVKLAKEYHRLRLHV